MNPAASDVPSDSAPAAQLQQQASANLQKLLKEILQAQDRQAGAAVDLVQRSLDGIQQAVAHTYSVFQVAAPKRYLVLRDVSELNGTSPLFSDAEFSSALAWVNQRMLDGVAHPPPASKQPAAAS